MRKKKSILMEAFSFNKAEMGYFFFGVGITMFLLNLITVVQAIKLIGALNLSVTIPMAGYYISLVSSVILMTYSLYNIYVVEE